MSASEDLENKSIRSESIDLSTIVPSKYNLKQQQLKTTSFETIQEENKKDIVNCELDDKNEKIDQEYDEDLVSVEQSEPPPRMHVLVAVTCTLSWIFFCAALFKIWEEWTYAESCYFMFIR